MTAKDITEAIALAARFIQLRLPFYNSIFQRLAPKRPYNYNVISNLSLYVQKSF